MDWTERMRSVNKIYEKLKDEESRFIFEQRIEYLMDNKDDIRFWNNIKRDKKWVCPNKYNDFIIFGAGKLGKLYLDILETAEKNVVAFCDNFRRGIEQGKEIITVKEAVKKELPILIPWGDRTEARKQLLEYKLDEKYIIEEPDIRCYTGIQYFDVWAPRENEILVDCGAYDGDTINSFLKWTNCDYGKIYAFEPSRRNYEVCKENIRDINNCILVNKGTWSTSAALYCFSDIWDTGDYIKQDNIDKLGGSKIEGVAIDEVLQGNEVTFIKMDVEGSELMSLKGAKNTIIKWKPRLAISAYHKLEDIFDIPIYILELNDGYQFKLRHYSSGQYETVLYAE